MLAQQTKELIEGEKSEVVLHRILGDQQVRDPALLMPMRSRNRLFHEFKPGVVPDVVTPTQQRLKRVKPEAVAVLVQPHEHQVHYIADLGRIAACV